MVVIVFAKNLRGTYLPWRQGPEPEQWPQGLGGLACQGLLGKHVEGGCMPERCSPRFLLQHEMWRPRYLIPTELQWL